MDMVNVKSAVWLKADRHIFQFHSGPIQKLFRLIRVFPFLLGKYKYVRPYCLAAVAEWLRSWLAEQEDRGSIPGLAT